MRKSVRIWTKSDRPTRYRCRVSSRRTADGRRALREFNRQRVLASLGSGRGGSRSEPARLTGLSRTTLTHVLTELQREGLVIAKGPVRATGPGRPAALLTLARPAGLVVGVDLGHSHVRVLTADLAGTVLGERVAGLDIDQS